MFVLYDIIFALFAVLYFPCMIIRGKWHSGFKVRWGGLEPLIAGKLSGKPCLWVHAVSVGEVLAVDGLIRKIRQNLPEYQIVCSVVTKTGYQLAQETLSHDCTVIYAPLDFSWVVRKFIRLINPVLYISTETEIWPNLYTALHKSGVAIIQVNGRISDKAFKGYRRVRFLIKQVLDCVNIFCMQSVLDAKRIAQLGAAPGKIRVVGNLKFDNIPASIETGKEDLGFQEGQDLLIAGSTHPGEEGILIEAYRQLSQKYFHLRLVIAPRHVERTDAIMELITKKGYKPVRFSEIRSSKEEDKSIVVVDTIGQLRALYRLAAVVFIGKTLTVGGGQNMIESAYFGKPTVVGPLTQNFKDVMEIFLKAEAIIQVKDAEELMTQLDALFTSPDKASKIGEAARQTVAKYQGATLKTVEAISELLAHHPG